MSGVSSGWGECLLAEGKKKGRFNWYRLRDWKSGRDGKSWHASRLKFFWPMVMQITAEGSIPFPKPGIYDERGWKTVSGNACYEWDAPVYAPRPGAGPLSNWRQRGSDNRSDTWEQEPEYTGEYTAVKDGDIFELGERALTAAIPGHSEGSVCYLDSQSRVLFSGDTVNRHYFNASSLIMTNVWFSCIAESLAEENLGNSRKRIWQTCNRTWRNPFR